MATGSGLGSTLSPLGITGAVPAAAPTFTTYTETVSEGIATALAEIVARVVTATDLVSISQTQIVSGAWGTLALDELGVTYRIFPTFGSPALAADTISLASVLTAADGIVLIERLRIALDDPLTHKFQLTTTETALIEGLVLAGIPQTISETIGLALAQQATLALQVIEALALTPSLVSVIRYGHTLTESIAIADTLARFLSGAVVEGLSIAPTLVGLAQHGGVLMQGIGVAESVTPQLIIRLTAADTIGLDDINVLRALLTATVAEGIEVAAAYLSPGDGVTTWAMNTRTGAVTEYSNYAFNSFARMGNKYLGASQDGLYELVGNTDDGTTILAAIKSGFAQWAGAKFTMFNGVYLGVRGGGEFVLKLTTGDGKIYHYGVSARDMRTTKVNVGKGLRSRYFAFELISAGQDFDLDTIEFVPLVAERRV